MRNRAYIYYLLLIISVTGAVLSLVYSEYFLAVFAISIVIISSILLLREYRVNSRKLTYMLKALENNDSSFRFTDKGGDIYNALFINSLNEINEIRTAEKLSASEKEKYYGLILENVITGVVSIDEKGYVIHCNTRALNLLGVSVLTHISQLKRIDEDLYNAFLCEEDDKGKIVSLFNEKGKVNLSLRSSNIVLRGKKIRLLVINDIGEELETNEIEAWTRLIRVLTHEIMNTVTPISSLSETLSMMLKNVPEGDEKNIFRLLPEIKNGLEVINFSSKGLISFVDSYRNLTRIPNPVCKPIIIKDFFNKILILIKDDIGKAHISPTIELSSEDIMIYADENLISQVILNLIKNAISALEERMKMEADMVPLLKLRASIDNITEDVILEVVNNGSPISKENQEHIFIPFFTTKSNGNGIGLAISRQIMRKHNGSLKLKSSNEKETSFVLIFR